MPLAHVPEAHEELQERRLAAAAAADDTDDGVRRDVHGDVIENRLAAVGERDVLRRRAVKADLRLARHLGDGGCLVEDVEDAVAGGKGVLQRAAERRERDGRPERREQRHRRDEHPVEADLPRAAERCRGEEHREVKQQDDRVRHGGVPPGDALHPRLVTREGVRARVHLVEPRAPAPELDRLGQAAQTVEHEARERAMHRRRPASPESRDVTSGITTPTVTYAASASRPSAQ